MGSECISTAAIAIHITAGKHLGPSWSGCKHLIPSTASVSLPNILVSSLRVMLREQLLAGKRHSRFGGRFQAGMVEAGEALTMMLTPVLLVVSLGDKVC